MLNVGNAAFNRLQFRAVLTDKNGNSTSGQPSDAYKLNAEDLYIEDASVTLINMADSSELHFYSVGNGRYYPVDLSMQNIDSVASYWLNYIILSLIHI